MMQLTPYLNFNGQCHDALAFYQQAFNSVHVDIKTFADMHDDSMSSTQKSRVMHAEFTADGVSFMATDGELNQTFVLGNNIHMSIVMDSIDEQKRLFDALSTGGEIVMPLQDTFWGARFGMCKDKFSIQWMMNVLDQHS